MKSKWLFPVVVIALLALAPAAKANVLTSGNTVAPDNFNGVASSGHIVIATGWVPWTYTTSGGTTSGLYDEWIFSGDANNPYGAAGMTFFIAVQNNLGSHDSITRITASNFGAFSTDVGFDNTDYCSFSGGPTCSIIPDITGVDPTTVNRSLNGDVIGFNWPVSAPLAANEWSDVLVIFTNASSYTTGQVALIDGATVNLAGYQPAGVHIPTTETSSLSLLGLAMGAGLLVSKRMLLA